MARVFFDAFYEMSLEIVNLLIKQIQFYCAATFNKMCTLYTWYKLAM